MQWKKIKKGKARREVSKEKSAELSADFSAIQKALARKIRGMAEKDLPAATCKDLEKRRKNGASVSLEALAQEICARGDNHQGITHAYISKGSKIEFGYLIEFAPQKFWVVHGTARKRKRKFKVKIEELSFQPHRETGFPVRHHINFDGERNEERPRVEVFLERMAERLGKKTAFLAEPARL